MQRPGSRWVPRSPPNVVSDSGLGDQTSESSNDAFFVDFDPRLLALAMTAAPRVHRTLERSLHSLRQGQFEQEVHLFAEPHTLPRNWNFPNVSVYQNPRRFGCFPNWLQAAQWLVTATQAPYLMLCEDDGIYCRGAADALYFGITHIKNDGCLSLYTPIQNYQAGKHYEAGWFRLRAPERWGTVAQCFPRAILEQLVHEANWSLCDGTDHYIARFLRERGLHWYSHAPSLVDHIGASSTLGHASGPENAGIGFSHEFVGYRSSRDKTQWASRTLRSSDAPLISIVLPVYNGQQFLRESIESCLLQSYTTWELILVDDGSTDDTADIIRSFVDPRVISIHHGINRRLPAALNAGFRQSRGELLTWTSCDNRYLPNALDTMVRFLLCNTGCDMVYSDFDFIDESGRFLRRCHGGPPTMLCEGNVVGACFLYHRRIYELLDGYSEDACLAEDYEYWLRCASQFRLTHLPLQLYEYRLHSASLTSRFPTQIAAATKAVRRTQRT
jgi:hypothetical protein